MNVLLNLNDIKIENIFLMDKVKNNVLQNSDFIKIIYSNNIIGLNGIYIKIILNNYKLDLNNNKIKKYIINIPENNEIINNLFKIEENILSKINKNYQQNIQKQIINGIYKCNIIDNKLEFILKISGIWISTNTCGLTFKLM